MGRILLLSMILCAWSTQAQGTDNNCPVVDQPNQNFCESQGTGNNFYRPAVVHLAATANGDGIVWYDTATSTEPLSPDEFLINGEDYFAGNASGTCTQRQKVEVTLNDSPNAGRTTIVTFKEDDAPVNLLDVFQPSILGPPDAGGTFRPALASGGTVFDPAVDAAGKYGYFVESTNDQCPDDEAYIFIKIEPASGDPGSKNCPVVANAHQSFCESQGTGNNFYRPAVAHLAATANGDGIVWYDTATSTEPLSPDEFLINGEDYFAGNASGTCVQRQKVEVTLNDSPNAGRTTIVTFKEDDAPVDLLDIFQPSILGPPDAGGTFSPALASGGTVFDPAVDLPGKYTYSVESSNDQCPDDEAVIYIKIEPASEDPGSKNCPVVANAHQSFCESQGTGNDFYRPAVAHLAATANGDGIVWYDTATSTEPLSQDELLANGEDYFAGNASGTCVQRQKVEVTLNDSPNAGRTTQITFCSNDEPIDLLTVYQPSILGPPDAGGTFTPALAGGGTVFDPAVDAGGKYTYTVMSSTDQCPDDQSGIFITVIPAPDAGANGTAEFSPSDGPQDLFNFLNGTPDGGGIWSPALASGSGVFDPEVDEPGTYTYRVTVNGCEDSSEVEVSISGLTIICHKGSTMEVNQNALEGHLKHGDTMGACESNPGIQVAVYPNPSNGIFNISVSNKKKVHTVNIFDLQGNLIKRVNIGSEQSVHNFNISSLRPSMYFAEIITDNGKIVKRILKN